VPKCGDETALMCFGIFDDGTASSWADLERVREESDVDAFSGLFEGAKDTITRHKKVDGLCCYRELTFSRSIAFVGVAVECTISVRTCASLSRDRLTT